MTIEQMAFVDQLSNYLPLENGKVQLLEIVVREESGVSGKQIVELDFPEQAIIGSIIRGGSMIIPNGRTELRTDDKLIILTNSESRSKVIESLVGGSSL
jgi:trk system potassium uptake protein TrkA